MLGPHDGGTYVDATFGPAVTAGASRGCGNPRHRHRRDRSAVTAGFDLVDRSEGRLTLVEDRFSNLAKFAPRRASTCRWRRDGFGVSSMQLDEADRGFSFRLGGPLDMRMGHEARPPLT